jgi:PEP-CTERM motif
MPQPQADRIGVSPNAPADGAIRELFALDGHCYQVALGRNRQYLFNKEKCMSHKLSLSAMAVALSMASMPGFAQSTTIALGAGTTYLDNFDQSGRQVPLQFVGGAGEIQFSNGGIYDGRYTRLGGTVIALNVITGKGAQNVPQATDGATMGAPVVTWYYGNGVTSVTYYETLTWQTATVNQVDLTTAGSNAGQLNGFSLPGGMRIVAPFEPGTAAGGQFQIDNIRIDLSNRRVMADLSGESLPLDDMPATTYNRPDTVLWTFDGVTGATRINPDSLLSANPASALRSDGFTVYADAETTLEPATCYSETGYGTVPYACMQPVTREFVTALRSDLALDNLEMSQEALDIFKGSLGLGPLGEQVTDALNNGQLGPHKWGTMNVSAFFSVPNQLGIYAALPASIPEPSTYALMGLGLLGVWAASRRSAATTI